jgi:hypothetical protein
MNPKNDAMIEHLINQGAVKMHSIDPDGYILYKITEKLRQVNPGLYQEIKDQYEDHMFKLVDQGPTTMVWKLNG